jgi:L-alanine-DL-glutamate epimerase-like enolase superfamily enzyme
MGAPSRIVKKASPRLASLDFTEGATYPRGVRATHAHHVCPRVLEESFDLKDGSVAAPERPGLGVTLRREVVRRLTVVA